MKSGLFVWLARNPLNGRVWQPIGQREGAGGSMPRAETGKTAAATAAEAVARNSRLVDEECEAINAPDSTPAPAESLRKTRYICPDPSCGIVHWCLGTCLDLPVARCRSRSRLVSPL